MKPGEAHHSGPEQGNLPGAMASGNMGSFNVIWKTLIVVGVLGFCVLSIAAAYSYGSSREMDAQVRFTKQVECQNQQALKRFLVTAASLRESLARIQRSHHRFDEARLNERAAVEWRVTFAYTLDCPS